MGCGTSREAYIRNAKLKRKFERTKTIEIHPSKSNFPSTKAEGEKNSEEVSLIFNSNQENLNRIEKIENPSEILIPKNEKKLAKNYTNIPEIPQRSEEDISPYKSIIISSKETEKSEREKKSISSSESSEEDNKDYIKKILVCEENLTNSNRKLNRRDKGVEIVSPKKRWSVNLANRGNNFEKIQKWGFQNEPNLRGILPSDDVFEGRKIRKGVFGHSIIIKKTSYMGVKKLPSLPVLAPHNSKSVKNDKSVFRKKAPAMAIRHSDVIKSEK